LGLTEAVLWTLAPWEYAALREVYADHVQRQTDMFAALMTVLHRAHFQGTFTPEQFGGSKPRPATIEDIVGRQTWQEKQAIFRSMLMTAWAAKKKRLEAAKAA